MELEGCSTPLHSIMCLKASEYAGAWPMRSLLLLLFCYHPESLVCAVTHHDPVREILIVGMSN